MIHYFGFIAILICGSLSSWAQGPCPSAASDVEKIASFATCPLTSYPDRDSFAGPDLSAYWAQEYIGADLAKDDMQTLSFASPVAVGVMDGGLVPSMIQGQNAATKKVKDAPKDPIDTNGVCSNYHGTCVSSLVNGPETGVTQNATLTMYDQATAQDVCQLPRQQRPRLLNMSYAVGDEDGASCVFKNEGIIPVVAAGNDFPQNPIVNQPLGGIIVGSATEFGTVTDTSCQGEAITILAPSSHHMTAALGETPVRFGATSGATPLVTGSIANAMAILPSLDMESVKTLLQLSAIPIFSSNQTPRQNGAGMVNAYKMVKVAKRVRDACLNDAECIRREIKNEDHYRFPISSSRKDIDRAFPECADGKQTEIVPCQTRQAAFRMLRQDFLLTLNETSLLANRIRDRLSCVLRNDGRSAEALFYSNVQKAIGGDSDPFDDFLKAYDGKSYASQIEMINSLTRNTSSESIPGKELLAKGIRSCIEGQCPNVEKRPFPLCQRDMCNAVYRGIQTFIVPIRHDSIDALMKTGNSFIRTSVWSGSTVSKMSTDEFDFVFGQYILSTASESTPPIEITSVLNKLNSYLGPNGGNEAKPGEDLHAGQQGQAMKTHVIASTCAFLNRIKGKLDSATIKRYSNIQCP